MTTVIASSPGKIILFGEHGVNRQQAALSIAVDLRLFCRVSTRIDDGYHFRSGKHSESGSRTQLLAFKAKIDALRKAQALDAIREEARDFFASSRYVLSHVAERVNLPGIDVEWRSPLPIGSGMGSGAATSTALALAAMQLAGAPLSPDPLAWLAWQGDAIAHGGISSSLDSSTCAYGGLIRFTVAEGAQNIPLGSPLPLIIGDTRVEKTTAEINTRLRKWLEVYPERMHLFGDVGYLVQQAAIALEQGDMTTLGHLMNLHELFQEKIATNCAASDRLIEAALAAGALGAKISGSGGGGIIIALAQAGQEAPIAAAIDAAGGKSYVVAAGAAGTRLEPLQHWDKAWMDIAADP